MRTRLLQGALTAAFVVFAGTAWAVTDRQVQEAVIDEVDEVLSDNGVAGAAVAIRIDGRTLFYNFGKADSAGKPVTSDSLFNLASLGKTFDVTLLSMMVNAGELSLDEPVAKYVPELEKGGDIKKVTFGQLVSYTSGLSLPQDHPPWPKANYTLPSFLSYLTKWKIKKDEEPGKFTYSHAAYMLLHVALERKFNTPYATLLEERLLRPLGLTSTILPLPALCKTTTIRTSRSARRATCRASTTGRAPARCSRRRATWRNSSRSSSAKFPSRPGSRTRSSSRTSRLPTTRRISSRRRPGRCVRAR
jgi:CubicO group peptidase (beta-lactamase class C family)